MDKGDFSNDDFKQTTTWKVVDGNWDTKGGISISSIEIDEQGDPKLCAKENANCKCTGTIFYGADKGGVLDKSKGWSKRAAEKDGDTVCSNSIMGGDPLPGTVKACFCSASDKDDDDKPFYFDAAKVDPFYNLKVSMGKGVSKRSDGTFSFKNSLIKYSGSSLQIKAKRNGKKENPEAMPTHNWELSFMFKTKSKKTGLFQIDNPTIGGYDRDFSLQGGYLYGYVWPGKRTRISRNALNDNQWHSFSIVCEDGTKCTSTIDGKKQFDLPIDHSNFDWASRIVVGYSRAINTQFTGEMKQIVYKTTKMSESGDQPNIGSAAEYVKEKKSGSQLVINEDVNIDEVQFTTLVYQAVIAGVNSLSFEGKVNFINKADKWQKILESFPSEERSEVCIQISSSVTSEDKDVPAAIMLSTISGGGWKKVRHTAQGKKWAPATDQLKGTQSYGDPKDDSKSWSLKFDNEKFDEILFATGDFDMWMTMSKKEAIGEWYSGQKRTITKSSLSCQKTTAQMYRRSGNKEDPWISLKDHGTSIREGSILYGENSYGGRHAKALSHDGADVYIRVSTDTEKDDDDDKPESKDKKCPVEEVQVKYLGDSGCTKGKPCDVGEGDCDTDADCKAGLKCGQRDTFQTTFPGLKGLDKAVGSDKKGGGDYCYDPNFFKKAAECDCDWFDPTPVKVKYLGDSACTKGKPCNIGEGDCDTDADCKHGLKCGQRNKFESLPGLTGFDKKGQGKDKYGNGDYCYDPYYKDKAEAVKAAKDTCIDKNEKKEEPKKSEPKKPAYCPVKPVQVKYLGDSGCTKGKPCDVGEGDCDSDADCKTGLKCGQRDTFQTTFPGLIGLDKPTGTDRKGGGDYCYDPNFFKKAAECDCDWFDPTPVKANYKGDSACTKGSPCDIGEGDCDQDTDCKHGLKCGQRNRFESLPGITGFDKRGQGKDKNGNGDYCYDPYYKQKAAAVKAAKNTCVRTKEKKEEPKKPAYCPVKPVQVKYLGDSGCTKGKPCDVGEGDCDTDADCKAGLKCGQRDTFQTTFPGLIGLDKPTGTDRKGGGDYCYDPDYYKKAAQCDCDWFDPTPVKVKYLGDSACTKGKPCDIGEGDCDQDTDCKHGLKCGQRNRFESLPGLTGFDKKGQGKDKYGNGDYCYDPEYKAKAAAVKAAKDTCVAKREEKVEPKKSEPKKPAYCPVKAVQVKYLGHSGCTKSKPCDVGEGDCDRDSDCKKGLKCGQRNSFHESFPGLVGMDKPVGADKRGDGDYCYDPNFYTKAAECDPNWFDPTPVKVKYLGDSACTKSKQCNIGEGDCDQDTDCKHGLKCGQRNRFEGLPGLTGFDKKGKGKDKYGNGDYCYDPDYNAKKAAVKAAASKRKSLVEVSQSIDDEEEIQENIDEIDEFDQFDESEDHSDYSLVQKVQLVNMNNIKLGMRVERRADWPSKYGKLSNHPPANKQGKIIAYSDAKTKNFGKTSSYIKGQLQWSKLAIVQWDDKSQGSYRVGFADEYWLQTIKKEKKASKPATKPAPKKPANAGKARPDGPWASMKVVPKEEAKKSPATFIRHRNYLAWDEPVKNDLDKKDSTFIVHQATYGKGVHFESVNFPKYYVKHHNFRLRIGPYSRKDLFIKDSTWIPIKVEC